MCRSYLREFYFSLGDDGAPDEKQRQLQRLGQLLGALGVDIAAEAAEREAANGAAQGAEDASQQQAKVIARHKPCRSACIGAVTSQVSGTEHYTPSC